MFILITALYDDLCADMGLTRVMRTYTHPKKFKSFFFYFCKSSFPPEQLFHLRGKKPCSTPSQAVYFAWFYLRALGGNDQMIVIPEPEISEQDFH